MLTLKQSVGQELRGVNTKKPHHCQRLTLKLCMCLFNWRPGPVSCLLSVFERQKLQFLVISML